MQASGSRSPGASAANHNGAGCADGAGALVVVVGGGLDRNRAPRGSERPPGKGPARFGAGRHPRAGVKASPARSGQCDDGDRWCSPSSRRGLFLALSSCAVARPLRRDDDRILGKSIEERSSQLLIATEDLGPLRERQV